MFAFTGVFEVGRGAFRGAGRTTTALALALLALWGVRVPATYLLAFQGGWGTTGIWWSVVLGDVVGAAAVVAWLLRGTWTSAVVDPGVTATTDD
jgi:Na+-driven multidrug efflux pump